MATRPLLSAVMVIKNGVLLGYPFVEAILSLLPLCDEFVITEGHSDDETYYWLERLQRAHPKIVLDREPWPTGRRSGHAIGEMQTRALKKCRGKWIYLAQADEIMPEENIRPLRELCDPLSLVRRVKAQRAQAPPASPEPPAVAPLPAPTGGAREADANDARYSKDLNRMRMQDVMGAFFYNSYQVDFVHLYGTSGHVQFTQPYRWARRLARNRRGLFTGNDGWVVQGRACYPIGTARLPHPIIHLPETFPVNRWRKQINHAALYPDLPWLQERAQEAARHLAAFDADAPPQTPIASPFPLPPLVASLLGLSEYRVREELFQVP